MKEQIKIEENSFTQIGNNDITTIINYCTNDYRYLDSCISEAKKFSKQIIISVCDHFFDGRKECRELLHRSYTEHPDCDFVEFEFDNKKSYGFYTSITPESYDWIHYWHSTNRYVGFNFVNKNSKYVLFIDVDEICSGDKFLNWLNNFNYKEYDVLRFYSYFYFRKPQYRSKTFSINALMIKKDIIQGEELLSLFEREGVFFNVGKKKLHAILDFDKTPLFHHYSWVKPKKETCLL